MHPDLITGKSIRTDVAGGGEAGRFGGESGKFRPSVSSVSRRGGDIIVEGISAANKIIQREELVESTLPEKRATGERAAARQCLPPGEGERPAAARASQPARAARERMLGRVRPRGLEEGAELGEAGWQSPPRAEEPDRALPSPSADGDRPGAPGGGADPHQRGAARVFSPYCSGELHFNDCAPAVARRDGATSRHNETPV